MAGDGAAATDGGSPPFGQLPDARGLISAEVCSAAGSTVAAIGVAYLSYEDSQSVMHTVLVSAAYSLPTAVLGTFAGRVAARAGHRQLLLICTAIKFVLYLVMAGLAFVDALTVPLLMVTSVLVGAVAAFHYPAWMEYERDIVPDDRLDQANASLSAYASGATLIAGLVGGVLLGISGAWVLLLLNAVSYVVFMAVLLRARPTERDTRQTERVGIGAVVRYVRGNRPLRSAFAQTAILGLFIAPVAQLLPAIGGALSEGSNLGILTAAVAIGAIGLAAVVGRLRHRFSRVAILNGTFVVSGVLLFTLGLFADVLEGAPLWLVVLVALVPFGLLLSLAQAVLTAVVQTKVDPDMEGSIFSIYAIIYTLCAPLGGLALGRFADQHDVWDALKVAGVMAVVASVTLLVLRHRRARVDGSTPPATPDPAPGRSALFDGLLRGHLLHLHPHRDRPSAGRA